MQVSIAIPTYNRAEDLDKCFNSLIVQTVLPKEIIMVDDSDNDEIEKLIEKRNKEFKEKNILLKYIRNEKEKSTSIARNIGAEKTTGDIILFLDSDVILDEDYIKEILKVYEENKNALGVQGYIKGNKKPPKKINIWKLLFINQTEKNKCRVLPSTLATYPYYIDKIISCEWLSGSNQSYKKEIFKEFKFDEKMKRYAYKEDIDLSYRIFKKYPNSLFMTPHAKLIHSISQIGRIPQLELIKLKEIYILYFFYKNINQTFKNNFIFLGSRISYLIFNFIFQQQKRFLQLKYQLKAYSLCIKHLKEIKEGDLEFFNKILNKN